jgi:signal transduction histidine kinase
MARDLHDVIGHNISLINVQAAVGLDLMDSQPDQARAALAAIKVVSKEALNELRTMLTALREDDEDAPRSPAPGLTRLPELVDLTRAAGLSVSIEVRGDVVALPTPVDLAESLTNVARHAGPVAATVRLTYETSLLVIEVVNYRRVVVSAGPPAAAAGPPAAAAGSGIIGMRERASALGGTLRAGPRAPGGFRVTARLPFGEAP